ncbi:MAG: preprotein translocase subunit YajC [Alphaproteobacteria bacterium]
MLIAKAYAQASEALEIDPATMELAANAPGTGEAILSNLALVLLLVVMFYFLLIRPQQKRFKEHGAMLDGLKKGDRVVTGGGLVGKIDKLVDDKEVIVDLGGSVKVTALRSSLQGKADAAAPANDVKPEAKAAPKKKAPAKKKETKK